MEMISLNNSHNSKTKLKTGMKNLMKILAVVMTVGLVALNACKDDDPAPLDLATVTANDIDLNGATSPSNIPIDPTVTITFSTDVDAATATNSNITITRDYDKANIPAAVTATGSTVTVKPNATLNPGALFVLSIGAGVQSTKGVAFTPLTRNFTTVGTFAPDGAKAYWTFEDNANDVVSTFDPSASGIVSITYGDSHNGSAGKAAVFNGTSSIIEIPNGDQLMNPTGSWAISFWAKPKSAGHVDADGNPKGHFVLGLGAFYGFQFEIRADYSGGQFPLTYSITGDTKTVTEGFGFNADGKNKDNGGWQGWEYVIDLTGSGGLPTILKDNWVHVVYSFDQSTKKTSLYFNGKKIQVADFNLWPAGDDKTKVTGTKYGGAEPDVKNELAFGFVQSRAGTMWDDEPWGGYDKPGANHFEGSLDDVIIYHKAITEAEIQLMYNSGK
jgi:hypothetical protein